MTTLKIAAVWGLWALAGATLTVRDRAPGLYPAALALAAAVTAATLADDWQARRGDRVTESVLAALDIDRETHPAPGGPVWLRAVPDPA